MERQNKEQRAFLTSITFDTHLYGANKLEGYASSIPADEDDHDADAGRDVARRMASLTGGPNSITGIAKDEIEDDSSSGFKKPRRIIDREDDYRRRRLRRILSPDRNDPFATWEATPHPSLRTYADVMREQALTRQKEEILREIANKEKEKKEAAETGPGVAKKAKTSISSDWDMPDSTPGIGPWDATPTPGRAANATATAAPPVSRRNRWDETPSPGRLADDDAASAGTMTWDATPKLAGVGTPKPKRKRSRWDETPAGTGSAMPSAGIRVAAYMPEQYNVLKWERDINGPKDYMMVDALKYREEPGSQANCCFCC